MTNFKVSFFHIQVQFASVKLLTSLNFIFTIRYFEISGNVSNKYTTFEISITNFAEICFYTLIDYVLMTRLALLV